MSRIRMTAAVAVALALGGLAAAPGEHNEPRRSRLPQPSPEQANTRRQEKLASAEAKRQRKAARRLQGKQA